MSRKFIQDCFALFLTAVAWFWTAYECHTIGIQVFDSLLKIFPGQLWIMAAVLTYLTFIWMRKHLITRAIMAIFMLMPAEVFKVLRPILPESGFAPVQILVALFYLLAIIGMYGMFYPWNIEKFLAKLGLVENLETEEKKPEPAR
ncbi:hypothetical protein [uncultured Fibrobacter sp.]|uniref:hypothetical protein n=1 Tax=uncultured Fibrobacter sp. TaxID=261512 RepID=UPI00261FC631|nr:hypothetical protein [uncultured Fibrobacter sp.]